MNQEQARRDLKDDPPAIVCQPTIGQFEVVRELGRGGHGVVFLARDRRIDRLVALKVPRPEVLTTPELHRRFLREARAASALAHPNLVPIHEAGDDGPLCYIAAGYCEGPTLANWLKGQSALLPFDEAAGLIATLADAAAHAHARGIIHRDIKPANVLLAGAKEARSPGAVSLFGEPRTPCLTDFGLARLIDDDASDRTRTGTMLGTPANMAPEQADGRTEEIGPPTDVYALGVMLYEVLVGRPPFRGANDMETLRLVSAAELVPPSVLRPGMPRDLEAICLRALACRPTDRYQTATALTADLRRYLNEEPTEARPLSRLDHAARWLRRRPAWSALSAVCVAAVITISGGGWWYSTKIREALAVASRARRHIDDRRDAAELRSAWIAFNSDDAAQATAIMDRLGADRDDTDRLGFAWQLLRDLTKQESMTLRGHTGDVYQVAFSPDEGRLASASQDCTVRVWDTKNGKSLATLSGHSDEVTAVAWSRQGSLLASASRDGTVHLWDPTTFQPIEPVLRPACGAIESLVFSIDGDQLVSGDDNGSIVFTETSSWQPVKTFETGGGRVLRLALSQDGNWLAATTEKQGVLIWGLWASMPPRESPLIKRGARGVAFDRDRLWCCGDDGVYRWHWSYGHDPIIFFSKHKADSITPCAHGWMAAIAGQDGIVHVFDHETAQMRERFVGHSDRIWSVAASSDGWRIATGCADRTVRLWWLSAARSLVTSEQPALLARVVFAPDGHTLFASRSDGKVQKWRLKPDDTGDRAWKLAASEFAGDSADVVQRKAGAARGYCRLAVSPTNRVVAICRLGQAGVELWDAQTGQTAGRLLVERDTPGASTTVIAFSPNGEILAEGGQSSVRLWDPATRRVLWQTAVKDSVAAISFSPDGLRMAVASGTYLELLDVATGKLGASWHAHQDKVDEVAFSPMGLIASAGADRLVCLWDGVTGKAITALVGHTHVVTALTFSPDGAILASGGLDETVKLWSMRSYEELATLNDFPGTILGLAFSPTHQILAAAGLTGDQRGQLYLWCAGGSEATWPSSR